MNGGDELTEQEQRIKAMAQRMLDRGASREEVVGFVNRAQERLAKSAAERPLKKTELAKGMARGIGQGITFNFGDELEAAAESAFGPETYAERVAKIRGEQNEFREKEPALAMASEIAGSVVPGVGLAKAAAKGAKGAKAIAARVAASGAGGGAVAGAGSGEGGILDRADEALIGAGIGAGAGYVGGKIVEKVPSLLVKAEDALRAGAQKVKGLRGRVQPPVRVEAGGTPEARQLSKFLKGDELEALTADSPETRIVDVLGTGDKDRVRVGTQAQRELRRIKTLGGKAGEDVERELGDRAAGQQERLTETFYGEGKGDGAFETDNLAEVAGGRRKDVFKTADELIEAKNKASHPLYEAFKAHGAIDDPAINEMLHNPGVQKLWNKARAIAEQEALSSKLGGKPDNYVMPTIEEITRRPVGGSGVGTSARTGSGRLTQNLTELSDEALSKEYARLMQSNSDDAGAAANLRKFESDDHIAGFASTKSTRNAGGRIASREQSIAKLEAELARRKIDKGDALWLGNEAETPGVRDQFGNERATEEVVTRRAVPDARALDYLKQAMDDEIDMLGPKENEGRALSNLRERLLDRLDNLVPVYKEARATYAGHAKLQDALKAGTEALHGDVDPREITKAMAGYSDGERELYRRGAIDAIRQRIERAGDHSDVSKALSNPAFRKRVSAIYGDEAEKILRMLAEERQMGATNAFVLGGPNTADKAADIMQGGAAAMAQLATGGKLGAGKRAVQELYTLWSTPKLAGDREAMARALNTRIRDTGSILSLAEMLRAVERSKEPARAVRSVIGQRAGAGVP